MGYRVPGPTVRACCQMPHSGATTWSNAIRSAGKVAKSSHSV